MHTKAIFRTWIPFAVLITIVCGLVYASVQQVLRQAADDPQIQMAEDTARALDSGSSPEAVLPAGQVEVSRSLAPFVVVYDQSGQPTAASGMLNGKPPRPPQGVLDYAGQNGMNRVTWQPQEGVRIASVVVPYEGGFVLAGRSLREAEKREIQARGFAAAAWALGLLASLAAVVFGETALAGTPM